MIFLLVKHNGNANKHHLMYIHQIFNKPLTKFLYGAIF